MNGPVVPRERVASLDQRWFPRGSQWMLRLPVGTCLLCLSLPPVPVRATGFSPEKGSLAFLVSRSDLPCLPKARFCLLASAESLCPNCWPKRLMNIGNDKFLLALHFILLARHTYQHYPMQILE